MYIQFFSIKLKKCLFLPDYTYLFFFCLDLHSHMIYERSTFSTENKTILY